MEEIQRFLATHLSPCEWTLQIPGKGLGLGKTLLAQSGTQKAIVLLDADCQALTLLAEKQLTPPLLGSGQTADGRPFCVQTFVSGTHPDEDGYLTHLASLSEQVRQLQTHTILRAYLRPPEDESYRKHWQNRLEKLQSMFQGISETHSQKHPLSELLHRIAAKVHTLKGNGLVPCHGDMNSGNILITKQQVYLIDWEHLSFVDPIDDPANLLWWAYPKTSWPRLFKTLNFDFSDPNLVERFYLSIAFRALEMHIPAILFNFDRIVVRFLDDATRALNHQEPATRLMDWGRLGENQ